jgi:putative acetyltransferase
MPLTLSLSDLPSNENSESTSIELRLFRYEDAAAFRRLNEAWIKKYFGLEEQDNEVLGDPVGYIIEPGGQIIIATLGNRAVGCCALKPMEPGVFEVAKMAVAEDLRGRGIGRKVLARTIAEAKAMGATKLYLETNSKLANAIHLYETLGFQHLPTKQSPYVRANVFMELALTTAD